MFKQSDKVKKKLNKEFLKHIFNGFNIDAFLIYIIIDNTIEYAN